MLEVVLECLLLMRDIDCHNAGLPYFIINWILIDGINGSIEGLFRAVVKAICLLIRHVYSYKTEK